MASGWDHISLPITLGFAFCFTRLPSCGSGLRIDAQLNAGSRMGYYTGLSIVQMTDDLVLPAPMERTTPITGYPEGLWINLVSWSQDGRHIAFTVRSPGEQLCPACQDRN